MEQVNRKKLILNKKKVMNLLIKNVYDDHYERILKGKYHYPTGEKYTQKLLDQMIMYYTDIEDYEKCDIIAKVIIDI